jgi:hypothetical protein
MSAAERIGSRMSRPTARRGGEGSGVTDARVRRRGSPPAAHRGCRFTHRRRASIPLMLMLLLMLVLVVVVVVVRRRRVLSVRQRHGWTAPSPVITATRRVITERRSSFVWLLRRRLAAEHRRVADGAGWRLVVLVTMWCGSTGVVVHETSAGNVAI